MATLTPVALLNDNALAGIVDLDGACVQAVDTINEFFNTGNEVFVCSNGSASAVTATAKSSPDAYGRTQDLVLSIPAGKIGLIPFLNISGFNSGGKATVVLSSVTTVKIGVVRINKLH